VSDNNVQIVGALSGESPASPQNLLVHTFSDEIKISTMGNNKTIGISLKDRGAVLPVGHSANAAYWYDGTTGKFVTSTYYMQKLPNWVEKFNEKKLADKYLTQTWKTLFPIEKYTESTQDDNHFEQLMGGKEKPTFPYILPEMVEKMKKNQMKRSPYDLLRATPFGNTIVKEMALTALKEEKLGKTNLTDVLSISFSATDIAGHTFGPQSIEVEDIYLRLDRELEEILEMLDREVGENDYLLFLTADHAGAYTPRFLESLKIPAGYFDFKKNNENLKNHLKTKFGKDSLIEKTDEGNIYLNKINIAKNKINISEVEQEIVTFFNHITEVYDVFVASQIIKNGGNSTFQKMWLNGYYHKRSADILVVLKPNYLNKNWYERGGTGHGTFFNYDTHVPALFFGYKVPKGKSTSRRINIIDIAPTITTILNIQKPNGSVGEPIMEVITD
jgi:hypothetical protein